MKNYNFINMLFSVLISLILASCGLGTSGSHNGLSQTIVANVSKGPVDGATCNLMDDSGATITAPVKSVGGVATFENITYTGVTTIECSGGTYKDELTGSSKNLSSLKSVVNRTSSNVQTTQQVVLSPITTVAAKKLAGVTDTAQVTAVNTDIADELGLDGIDITTVIPTDTSGGATASNNAAGKYQLAIISMLKAVENTATYTSIDDIIDTLADDYNPDNSISSSTKGLLTKGMNDYIITNPDEFSDINAIKDEITANIGDDGATEADGTTPIIATPTLSAPSTITGVVGETITSWLPINYGDNATWTITSGTLTALGLDFDATTGKISGTPQATTTGTAITVKAENSAGNDTALVNIVVTSSLSAPSITNQSGVSVRQGESIETVIFNNTGGKIAMCSDVTSSSTLADIGLEVSASPDGLACSVYGVASTTATTGSVAYTIQAANATASPTATVEINVTGALSAPSLVSTSTAVTSGSAVNVTMTNLGGSELYICSVNEGATISGITVERTSDNNSCIVSGTPVATVDVPVFTANAGGTSVATVSIAINVAIIAVNTTYQNDATIDASGGTLVFTVDNAVTGDIDNTDFTITTNGTPAVTVSSVTIDGTTIKLTLSRTISDGDTDAHGPSAGETVTFEYTDGDSNGNLNDISSGTSVTNNSDAGCDTCVLDADGCPF
jgi:hypothetical protein